jgi:hypothetical protein
MKKHMHTKHSGQQHSSDLKENTSVKFIEQKKKEIKRITKEKTLGLLNRISAIGVIKC